MAKIASLCGDDLDIYSGNDDQILPVLSLGGIGVISVLSNVCPKECHNMVAEFLKGNISEAKSLQLKYIDLIDALFCDVNPVPVKAALNLMGYSCGECRMPLGTLSQESLDKLKNAMVNCGLI